MQVASINRCRRAQASIYVGLPELAESLGTVHRYEAENAVYRQYESAEHWYLMVSGAARKFAQMADGRRQIMDFLLPGDLFGFEAAAKRDCSVECVAANTTVVCYQRQRMESLMEADHRLARCIREITFGSIDRLQSRMMLLGRSRALERVCGFLLEMAQRAQKESEGLVALPMSRYDIADYLAIAVETVSRSLTTLRSEQVITFVDMRHFRIVNLQSLEARCCR
jgi:CRP/FNR family transcriptional regulator, nitrogen fixation regulation protein